MIAKQFSYSIYYTPPKRYLVLLVLCDFLLSFAHSISSLNVEMDGVSYLMHTLVALSHEKCAYKLL